MHRTATKGTVKSVAGYFASQVRAQDIVGSLDARVGMETGCPQPVEFALDFFRHLLDLHPGM
jgi:hypothetical protein